MLRPFLLLAGLLLPTPYEQSIEDWRSRREASLKADDGWLTVAGLHWLSPGDNSVDGRTFTLSNGNVYHAGKQLRPDIPGPADTLTRGGKTLFVISRGSRLAIRVRDKQSPYRKQFTGLRWFPVQQVWRIEADWRPYANPQKRSVPTIVNIDEQYEAPGVAEFTVNDQTFRLEPVLSEGKLFFIFKDTTAGKSTYPAGRFLYAELPQSGKAILDFNQAYNPPCAYTPYATCPLPPKKNHLPIHIEAGEKNYGAH